MRILVTFAVDAEFAPWRRRHAFERVEMPTPIHRETHWFYRGIVAGNDVDVLLTGIGWEENKTTNPPRVVLRELLKLEPNMLVSSGLAGGLASDLKVGDIAAASTVLLRTAGTMIRCNSRLLRMSEAAGALVKRVQVTETHVVSDPSAKAALADFADFVDMEGYHILQIVSGTKTPAISVRAISDSRRDSLPPGIENLVDREGHIRTLPLVKYVVRRPSRIPLLVDFGTKSKGAAEALADFLDRFLEEINGDSSEAQVKRERVAAR